MASRGALKLIVFWRKKFQLEVHFSVIYPAVGMKLTLEVLCSEEAFFNTSSLV